MAIAPDSETDRMGQTLGFAKTPAQTGAAAYQATRQAAGNKQAAGNRQAAAPIQPTETDKLIDTMVGKMAGEIAKPEPPPVPPAPFSLAQRIGMAALAGGDPEFYKSVILPIVQGQQAAERQYSQQVEGRRGDKDKAFNTLLGLAQRRDAQREMAESRQANESLRADELDRRVRADAEAQAQRDTLGQASSAMASGMHDSLPFLINQARSMANALSASDSPFEKAQANAIMDEAVGLSARSTALMTGISQGGVPNPALVGQLRQSMDSLQARIDQMGGSAAMREAVAKGRAAAQTRLQMIPAKVIVDTKQLASGVARVSDLLKQLPKLGKFGGYLGAALAKHPNLAKDASRVSAVFTPAQFVWLQEYSAVLGKIRPEAMGLAQTFIEMQKQVLNMPDPGTDSELMQTALQNIGASFIRDLSGYVDALHATGKNTDELRVLLNDSYNKMPDTVRAKFLVPPGMPMGTQFIGVVPSPTDPNVLGRLLIMPDGSKKFYREVSKDSALAVRGYATALGAN